MNDYAVDKLLYFQIHDNMTLMVVFQNVAARNAKYEIRDKCIQPTPLLTLWEIS